MKCGSCRATDAEAYTRIKADNSLFDVLKNLNADRVYNPKYSYFCEACIKLAKAKLIDKLKTISVQLPTSFTTMNESSAADDSDSPKDEYDLLVLSKNVYSDKGTPLVIPPNRSKRSADKRSMPCPKRFKKPLAPIQLQPIPETSSRAAGASSRQGTTSGPSTSRNKSQHSAVVAEVIADWSEERSSESISEEGMLLDVDDASSQSSASVVGSQPKTTTSNRSADSSNSLSSKDLPNQQISVPSGSKDSPNQPTNIPSSSKVLPNQQTSVPSGSKDSPNQPTNIPSSSKVLPNQQTRIPSGRKDSPNQPTSIPSGSKSKSDKRVSHPKTPPRRKDDADRNVSSSSDQRSNHSRNVHIVGTVPGPSAPPAKNPRIREDNANMPRDLRQYFSTQQITVSNYSRTLAG